MRRRMRWREWSGVEEDEVEGGGEVEGVEWCGGEG